MIATHLTDAARAALQDAARAAGGLRLGEGGDQPAMKETLAACGLKMPQVAIPLRVVLLGQPQSPSIDAVLEVLGRERGAARGLDQYCLTG